MSNVVSFKDFAEKVKAKTGDTVDDYDPANDVPDYDDYDEEATCEAAEVITEEVSDLFEQYGIDVTEHRSHLAEIYDVVYDALESSGYGYK